MIDALLNTLVLVVSLSAVAIVGARIYTRASVRGSVLALGGVRIFFVLAVFPVWILSTVIVCGRADVPRLEKLLTAVASAMILGGLYLASSAYWHATLNAAIWRAARSPVDDPETSRRVRSLVKTWPRLHTWLAGRKGRRLEEMLDAACGPEAGA